MSCSSMATLPVYHDGHCLHVDVRSRELWSAVPHRPQFRTMDSCDENDKCIAIALGVGGKVQS